MLSDRTKPWWASWLVIACATGIGWLGYCFVTWMDARDEVYIRLMESDWEVPVMFLAVLALVLREIGPVAPMIAGAVLGILVSLWLRWPRWITRGALAIVCLIIGSFAIRMIRSAPAPDAPEPTWVDPDKSEPEGSQYKTFYSKTIAGQVSYLIYLPEEYSKIPGKRYPVIYHLRAAKLSAFLARLRPAISAGLAVPMIVVGVHPGHPDSFYRDPPSGTVPIESVIIKDLVPHIDETYRTIPLRAARALEGASMGGFGSLYFATKYPEMFGAASSSCPVFVKGPENPWFLAKKNANAIRGKTRIRLLCGTEDVFPLRLSKAYSTLLKQLNISHEYLAVVGAGHGDVYEKLEGIEVIHFFHEAFRNSQTSD